MQRIVDNHNGMLELGTSERAGFPFARLPVPVTRAQGTTKKVIKREAKVPPVLLSIRYWIDILQLQIITASDQPLPARHPQGVGVFIEVVDKQFRQRFGFFLPLFRRSVGVTRIEDLRVYARQFGWDRR